MVFNEEQRNEKWQCDRPPSSPLTNADVCSLAMLLSGNLRVGRRRNRLFQRAASPRFAGYERTASGAMRGVGARGGFRPATIRRIWWQAVAQVRQILKLPA